jgi:hypothetical protein
LFKLARICQKAWSFGKKEIKENLKNAIDRKQRRFPPPKNLVALSKAATTAMDS